MKNEQAKTTNGAKTTGAKKTSTIKKPSVTGNSKTKVKPQAVKKEVKKNEEENVVMENTNVVEEVVENLESTINNKQEVVDNVEEVSDNKEEEKEVVEEEVVEMENSDTILTRHEFMQLPQKEQVKLMLHWRKLHTSTKIYKEMGLSMSQYYDMLEKIGVERKKMSPRGSKTNKTTKGGNSVKKQNNNVSSANMNVALQFGDVLLGSEIMSRIEALLMFVDQSSEYEFKIDLIKK